MVRLNAKIRVRDNGYAAFEERLAKMGLRGQSVSVGISAASGAPEHQDSAGKTILQIAEANEFGLGKIPERSFIRFWFASFEEKARAQMKTVLVASLQDKFPIDVALQRLGARYVGECQKNIVDGGNPPFLPNAASTVAMKGSSSPLIDHGQLKAAIVYIVNHPKEG